MIPGGLNNKIRELQNEHQQIIEEKDAALVVSCTCHALDLGKQI